MDKIHQLILEVREELNKEHNLNDCFIDMCDLACERLAKKLSHEGYRGKIVNGSVCFIIDEPEYEWGHHWIVLDDLIIDPTSDQFGLVLMIVKKDQEQYKMYKERNEVISF